ncbi:MAG: DUF5611 family protein [Candidatus Thermoplasmatota archaeon]|nr:DUF5611 family protein [Candidatus Thermoplasmatota archaeon]
MRQYKIKRGYNPNINTLLSEYFGVDGDVSKGVEFEVPSMGKISIRQEKSSLFIDTEPPKKVSGDYGVIKKWNDFLFDATGKTTKERKKEFGKA